MNLLAKELDAVGYVLVALWLISMIGIVVAAFWEFDQRVKGKR